MRKFLISAALAASTLAVAAPAAAQWAPQGYGYGYQNNYGQARALQARIDQVQRQIISLDRRNALSNREASRLMNESRGIEYRLRQTAYNGLNYRESRDIQVRIAQLEQRVYREARDGNRYYGNRYNNYDKYGAYPDRDRDHRDDRYEDDRGYRHD